MELKQFLNGINYNKKTSDSKNIESLLLYLVFLRFYQYE